MGKSIILSSRGQQEEAAAETFRAQTVNKLLKPNKCKQTLPGLVFHLSITQQSWEKNLIFWDEEVFAFVKPDVILYLVKDYCRHCSTCLVSQIKTNGVQTKPWHLPCSLESSKVRNMTSEPSAHVQHVEHGRSTAVILARHGKQMFRLKWLYFKVSKRLGSL